MSIFDNLKKIMTARYGEDVRSAIHDSILNCYEDGKSTAIATSEIAGRVKPDNNTIVVKSDGTLIAQSNKEVREYLFGQQIPLGPYFDELPKITKGITYTGQYDQLLEDGIIEATGTATANAYFTIWKGALEAGEFVIQGFPSGIIGASILVYGSSSSESEGTLLLQYDSPSFKTFKLNERNYISLKICIDSGAQATNWQFNPKISPISLNSRVEDVCNQINTVNENMAGMIESVENNSASIEDLKKMISSDEWNENEVYEVGEYCKHNNKRWKCLVRNKGQTPTEGTYWTQRSIDDDISSLNSNLENISGNVSNSFKYQGVCENILYGGYETGWYFVNSDASGHPLPGYIGYLLTFHAPSNVVIKVLFLVNSWAYIMTHDANGNPLLDRWIQFSPK